MYKLQGKAPAFPAWKACAGWVRTWLACVALYYPALWVCFSVRQAVPPLLRILFFHQQLGWLKIFPFGLMALSVPSDGLPDPRFEDRYDRFALGVAVFVVLAAILVLARAGRKSKTLGGLFVASFSAVSLWPPLADLFFTRHVSVQNAVSFLFFFAAPSVGLRWILNGWVRSGYWVRVGSLLVGFAALPLLVWAGLRLLTPFRFGTLPLLLMAPSAIAAM